MPTASLPIPTPAEDPGQLELELEAAEVLFPLGKRGRRPRELVEFMLIRPLSHDDLPDLELSPPRSIGAKPIVKLRSAHHNLARLMALGTYDDPALALLSGYDYNYLQTLKSDPAFQELLNHYSTERDVIFVDVLERMKILGIETLEQIQESVTQDPDKWSNREKMELAKLLIIEPMKATAGPAGGGGGAGNSVQLNVQFVQSNDHSSAPVLDVTANRKKFDD